MVSTAGELEKKEIDTYGSFGATIASQLSPDPYIVTVYIEPNLVRHESLFPPSIPVLTEEPSWWHVLI